MNQSLNLFDDGPSTANPVVEPSTPVDANGPWVLGAVAVARPVRGEFTYRVPSALQQRLSPGHRVQVPFGRGLSLGFYLGPGVETSVEASKLKSIVRVLDDGPALPADVLALLRFAADHYRYPLGEAIRAALPPGLSAAEEAQEVSAPVDAFAKVSADAHPESLRRAPAQAAVLSYLMAVGKEASVDELAHALPGSRDALKRLVERGWVQLEHRERKATTPSALAQSRPQALTEEQAIADAELGQAIDAAGFQPFLLHGVTGSGKTEVYLRAVEKTVERGKGALVLVPEIALTPQLVGRLRSRFGTQVAILHSALKDRERLRYWQRLRAGEIRIAVGVRSAVFAPVKDLGLVVVDEEHDGSFKQEDKLRYQARDLAVVRAKHAGAVAILGSATPSLETLENVTRGRYRLLTMHKRVDDRPMPEIELVDLRELRPRVPGENPDEQPILSPPVMDAMKEVLARGQQTILFLNRRGHSTFLLCEVCGQSVRCRDCDVSLAYHRSVNRVMCHYCGAAHSLPHACLDCQGPLMAMGVGTERVEAEVAERFPQARVARLDRDAASSAEKLTDLLASFARREIDILVGTQMVAKGHDFPGVTLVCVVLADTALSIPDFRASERTFQLLTQVAGRAGRGQDPGRVLVQTYNPDSEPLQRVLHRDFPGFAERQLAWRKSLAYPPYARMAALRIEGEDPRKTEAAAKLLGKRMMSRVTEGRMGVRLMGPAPAPIKKIKGRTRWQLLLKGPSYAALAPVLAEAEAALEEVPQSVRVIIDVDPGTML